MFYHNILSSLTDPNIPSGLVRNVFSEASQQHENSPAYTSAHAAACLETLLRLYYLRHGFGHYDTLLTHFLNIIGFNALEQLEHPVPASFENGTQNLLSTAMLCIHGYHDQGRNYYLAEIIYHLMRDKIRPEYRHLLRDSTNPEAERARADRMAEHTRAEYPMRVISLAENPEKYRLEQVIASSADLTLNDDSGVISAA